MELLEVRFVAKNWRSFYHRLEIHSPLTHESCFHTTENIQKGRILKPPLYHFSTLFQVLSTPFTFVQRYFNAVHMCSTPCCRFFHTCSRFVKVRVTNNASHNNFTTIELEVAWNRLFKPELVLLVLRWFEGVPGQE